MQEGKEKNLIGMRNHCPDPTFHLDVKKRLGAWKFVLCCACAIPVVFGCKFIRSDNLNQAIVRGDTAAIDKALVRGVNVNGRGMHDVTPLMKAAEVGRLDICELLIKHGADINGHNESGSVLVWAVNSRNEALVRFLVKSGADRSWSNAIGQTAESLARQRGLTNIVPVVTQH